MCVCVCVRVCVCVCACVCVCVCVYIYIYIHMYIYMYIYINIHIYACLFTSNFPAKEAKRMKPFFRVDTFSPNIAFSPTNLGQLAIPLPV